MQWWAWIAVGAILLGSELSFVDAQFYLVFIGASALLVGLLALAGTVAAVWVQWALFTALSVLCMLGFRQRIYERLRRNLPVMAQGPAGQTVIMPTALAPGDTCRVELHGSPWSAINAGAVPIAAGALARIERIDGLTLVVRADS